MTFRTQHLTNKFPKWTKIRRDPSSFGARMFSVFGDYFDFRGVELSKLKEELNLLKPHIGRPSVWKIELSEDDQLPVSVTTGGITTWTYPTTVDGTFSTGVKTLVRVENLEELLWSVPNEMVLADTIAVGTFTIWDSSSPTVYNTIDNPDRLLLVVENSTDYFGRTGLQNRSASGYHMLVIEGKDHNGLDFVEHLPVQDDGVYWTKNIISELTSVDTEGFDGSAVLYVNTATTSTRMLHDVYHLAASDSDEGILKLALSSDSLQYYVQRIKRGANYRKGGAVTDNDELIWEQTLADIGGTAVTGIVDIAINWDTARLYMVASNGTVYVYDHGLTPFTPPVDESLLTKDAYVEVQPLAHWASLNETMTFFTWFAKPRFSVVGVTIKRRDPSGNVEYLQANLSWAAGVYEFPGKDSAGRLPEETWNNLTFTNTFDEYGEWEFYCTTEAANGDITTMFTKVMVDKVTALAELTSGVATPTSIYFSETGQLCVTDASNIYKFDEHSHVYLASGPTQQLYFRENYSSVEVTL